MKHPLSNVFDAILKELKSNPDFRSRIDRILEGEGIKIQKSGGGKRRGNRRAPGVFDPYREYASSEAHLRQKLGSLTVDQLKDIVSEQSLDSARLALKWKSSERLIDLIVTTVRSRMQKGDAFRE